MNAREHKTLENRLRREAKRKGLLLRRNRTRDCSTENYELYVLIGDSCREQQQRPAHSGVAKATP